MRKNILLFVCFAAVIVMAAGTAVAQEWDDLNRQMDVTRDYEPTVGAATKLDIEPNMIDTVALRPESRYGITSMPVAYGFDVQPINPARVSLDYRDSQKPFYVKLMAGYPFQTLADIYATTTGRQGSLGAYLNHYGSWSKIENDMNEKAEAAQTFNKAGVLGEYRFGRYTVDGEVGYDYNMVTRYGYYDATAMPAGFNTSAGALRQNFSKLRGAASFGNTFDDLSYFNFRAGLEGGYFVDRFDAAEASFEGYLDLGKRFGGMHDVLLHGEYVMHKGRKNLLHDDEFFTVIPTYRLAGDKFSLSAGVNYTYNKDGDGDQVQALFPMLDIRLDVTGGAFVPYVKIDGHLAHNCYGHLVERNPYIESRLFMHNSKEYHGRGGITGDIGSSFSYNAYVGFSRYEGLVMFTNMYSIMHFGNTFMAIMDGADMYTVGGDIEGRISGSFAVELAAQYRKYNMDNLDKAIGIPDLTVGLKLKYYNKDRFSIYAGADVVGTRYFHDFDMSALPPTFTPLEKQDVTVDVKLGGEVRVLDGLNIVVDAGNLLNKKLYDFSRYPGLGANVMAGVKVVF